MSPLPLDDLPVARPAPVRSPAAARLTRLTRVTLTLLPLLAIGTWAAVDWRAVSEGAARLAAADPR
ncbi:UPF0104 family protein, partial [Streptomyces mirabilis]